MPTDNDPLPADLLATLLEASATALAAETLALGTFAWRGMGGARKFIEPDA